MKVVYTSHAKLKFRILEKHRVKVTKKQIEDTILRPDKVTKRQKKAFDRPKENGRKTPVKGYIRGKREY